MHPRPIEGLTRSCVAGLIQEFKEAGAHVVEPKYVTNSAVSLGGPSMVEVLPHSETLNPDL